MKIDRKPVRYAHSDGHTDVCYSEDGSKLLTCGTDGDIRIWNGFEDNDPIQTCVGDSNFCLRQKGSYIYVATDNNDIQILTYPEAERNGILIRFTAPVNHITVGKDDILVCASEDMEVKVLKLTEAEGQKEIANFSDCKGPPLSVCICPKNTFLAVSCGDGNLYIWEINNKELIKTLPIVPKANSFSNAKQLCRADFDPIHGKMLAYPNENCVKILNTSDWSEKCVLKSLEVDSSLSIVQFSPCGRFLAATSLTGDIVIWEVFSRNVVDVSRHSKPISLCSMMWNPSGNGEIAFCDVEGQLGVAVKGSNFKEIKENTPEEDSDDPVEVDFPEFEFKDDDVDEDEENTISISKLKNEIMGNDIEPELESIKESSRCSTPRPRTPSLPLQPPFMPSSTPEHLSPRYLCWNEVGIIQSFGSEDLGENKSIEVIFHDTTFHGSILTPNFQDYTMGSLSKSAVCFANSTKISVLLLSSGSTEWTLSVSEPEEIVCCACSDRLICFATNSYTVRVATVFGTQRAVFSVPGPVVCLSARDNTLMIAYHHAPVRLSDMCISIMLVDFSGLLPVNRELTCPLSPQSTLQWMGLTDVGSPAVLDSLGILKLFVPSLNMWAPFCDTTKQVINVSDGFFVTAVFESSQSVLGIRCKGSMYPGFLPRPAQSELPLAANFAEMHTEKSQLESNLFTWSSLSVDNVERKFKENAIKLFSLACQNNLDSRAFELMSLLNNPHLVTIATKYATNVNKSRLAEKLFELASTLKQSATEDSIKQQKKTSTPSSVVLTPTNIATPKLVTLSSSLKQRQKMMKKISQNKDSEEKDSQKDEEMSQTAENNSIVMNTSAADTTLNTQESLFVEEKPRNPFLKSLKQNNSNSPSLLSNSNSKENDNSNINLDKSTPKRKKPDLDNSKDESDKPKENKQRKLDSFRFTKRS